MMSTLPGSQSPASTQIQGGIRPPAVAGQFYPADSGQLRRSIERLLGEALPPRVAQPAAIIVPHAGWAFCGQIIADAFRQAADMDPELVILLGTNHTVAPFAGAALPAAAYFETPLGLIEIDGDAAAELRELDSCIGTDAKAHAREHSIEVALPFVQQLFPAARILPLVVGSPEPVYGERIGKALAVLARERRTLIVASSDLSHYPDYEDAVCVDNATLAAVVTLSPAELPARLDAELRRRVTRISTVACGAGPIQVAMVAARALGAGQGAVISYINSGDVALGSRDRVVGYGAVAFGTHAAPPAAVDDTGFACELTDFDGHALAAHARKTLEWYLDGDIVPLGRSFRGAARQEAGVFVTLRKRGELRGCVGHMSGEGPLFQEVAALVLSAAFEDRRFLPLEAGELAELVVEVSVLSTPEEITSADGIIPGRDGVIIERQGRSAVFLPEVAIEHGWGRNALLEHLCEKARLPRAAWKEGARLSVFQSRKFSSWPE